MKIKKIVILLLVLVLFMQTGCENKSNTKYLIRQLSKDEEVRTVDVVEEYKSYNISQKHIFNYFYNDIYKHYDYMCFNEALTDSEECREVLPVLSTTCLTVTK